MSQGNRSVRSLVVACAVFLVVSVIAAAVVARAERNRLRHERALVSGYAKDHARHLEAYIEHALSASYALAALVRVSNGLIPNFDQIAQQMLPFYPGASELVVSVGGTIRNIAPLQGNEKAIGLDLLNFAPQKDEASISRDSGKLTLAGPLVLVQGGLALAGRLPVFLDDAEGNHSFWGFTEVVMRLPAALAPAQLSQLVDRGYAYKLWRIDPQGRRQTIDESSAITLTDPVEQILQLPNGTWTLSIAPVNGWGDPRGQLLNAGLGLLFALLLAYLAKLLVDLSARGAELEALVIQRTASIAASKDHLKKALEVSKRTEKAARMSKTRLSVTLHATQIAIWDWDIKRDRWYASRMYFSQLGYTPEPGQPDRNIWVERVHPEDRPGVRAAIDTTLAGTAKSYEYDARILHADGTYRWMSVRGRIVNRDDRGLPTRMLGVRLDITEQKESAERIRRLALFDSLTELPNRTLFNELATAAIEAAAHNHEPLAVLVLNIDKFKNINDMFGRGMGDDLLVEFARRVKSSVGAADIVARTGGDEFAVILPRTDANSVAYASHQLLEALSGQYRTEQLELVITCSIGIAMYPSDGTDHDTLIKCADMAVHRAKHDGRNQYVFFTLDMQVRSARNLVLENALRRAIERSELHLHYQPQVSLQDGHITGVEALLRWSHPDLGNVSPAEFIPIAEDSGQILQIGTWVLRNAAAQLRAWLDRGIEPMTLAVNLSSVQFRHPNLPELIREILEEANLPARYLELELTERVAMGDPVGAIAIMDKLHQLGVRMSLDDFGTGYSSLNYLKRFRTYKLKIDQSFTSGVTEDPEDQGIVCAIVNLAQSLGLETIAEGVETDGQLAFLREKGCHEAQGYYFSKPVPAEQFEALLRDRDRVARWLG